MREIKLKVVTISNVDNCLIEISEPMSVKKVGDYIAERIDKDCVERYEYIQFTGLKDKNGKEIYEGDVVLAKEVLDYDGYREDKFVVIIPDVYLVILPGGSIRQDNVEVVGNIYENSDLLTNN